MARAEREENRLRAKYPRAAAPDQARRSPEQGVFRPAFAEENEREINGKPSQDQVLRPSFALDQETEMAQRSQEDWAAYPDMVYQASAKSAGAEISRRQRRSRSARHIRGEAEDGAARNHGVSVSPEWTDGGAYQQEAAYPAAFSEEDGYSDGGIPTAAPPLGGWAAGGAPRKKSPSSLWTIVALGAFAAVCLLLYAVISLRSAEKVFEQKAAIVNQSVIAQGVTVDGVHVGGMTKEEALRALSGESAGSGGEMRITLEAAGETWTITQNELPLERNLSAVLDTAYAVGRQGSKETIASSVTPFEYRYQHLYHTVTTPVKLKTTVTYDPARVRELVGIIENRVNRDAVDAQVATFDFNTRSFTFTQDQAGRKIDGEALYRQLLQVLDKRQYAARIIAETQEIQPRVTAAQLNASFALISQYTTQTTSDSNRNNNVNLACHAVMGTVVMPGETFSFNKTTGQRTTEKGYLPAAAILGGATVDEVGGGVCQVSSTLFNAAAMADLTILNRSPHTWPSNYVDKGRDATVNWPNLDFSFRNDRDTPIFIVAYYQQRQCTVELYGGTLGPGASIDLETRLISTTDPPADPIYEQNPLLEPGTVQEKKKARTGYVVETYKIYRQNGAEVKRELLCTSNYQMIQQVIEYN